ncbi:uncharacterized protein LOC112590186 isoform X2 [Harpegnathos saltator]|uniref:uncharacterized protein LOC112590186 isoform X2 n=1 Tax=Harpegnathos saltator TaxID=610380 RepID=UPI000DBEE810|nr:uncharacterized protein LOC112590186 isoform X2 [Harpegnathos saltator]
MSESRSSTVKKQRSSRASTLQIEDLISYMEKHSRFTAGRFNENEGKLQLQMQWDELCKRLNSLPGPKKSVKLWQTVWRDLKSVSSRKASKLRAERLCTGNFPAEEAPLQNIECVVSAIGLDYFEGNAHCPDSCVEDENIERLEMDDEDPLYQIPQTRSLHCTLYIFNVTMLLHNSSL